MRRVPVGIRLAGGFLVAGLVAVLASVCAGLLPLQTQNQTNTFQMQLGTANAELATTLVLLQAEQDKVHLTLEDAADGQPSALLLSDQGAAQSLAAEVEAHINIFVRENLLSQHPDQESLLNKLGQSEAIERQQRLVIGVISTWQRAHTAQLQVLHDSVTGQFQAAETLARAQTDPMEADVLSALYSLIQFESHLARAVQNAAYLQATHDQQMNILLIAAAGMVVILVIGLLVSASLLGPLHRLWKGTQAAAAGKIEVRVPVNGHDELAAISSHVNDMRGAINSLLAEINRQQQGYVSAAEHLCVEVSGEDESSVRAALAETGDPLKVLDMMCAKAIARFHGVAGATRSAAQQLEQTAEHTRSQAEAVLLDEPGAPGKFVQEVLMTARELETLAREWSKALPGPREEAGTEAKKDTPGKE